jgi:WD40 repeat protein
MATGGNDHTVILWDVTDPARAHRLGGPLTGYGNGVLTVAFAPDGHTLATADAANTVVLWDVADPSHPHRLATRSSAPANALTFTPYGRTLLTGGSSNSAQLWDVTALNAIQASPMSAACSLTEHGADLNQWSAYAPGIPYENTTEPASPHGPVNDGNAKGLALATQPVAIVAPLIVADLLSSSRIHVLMQIDRTHARR